MIRYLTTLHKRLAETTFALWEYGASVDQGSLSFTEKLRHHWDWWDFRFHCLQLDLLEKLLGYLTTRQRKRNSTHKFSYDDRI